MKFGKNVVNKTRYTDGYYKINIDMYNTAVQFVKIETPDDVMEVKSIQKLRDLEELLEGLLRDWDSNEATA